MFDGGMLGGVFVRRLTRWREEDLRQAKLRLRFARDQQMPIVRRIECTAEDSEFGRWSLDVGGWRLDDTLAPTSILSTVTDCAF